MRYRTTIGAHAVLCVFVWVLLRTRYVVQHGFLVVRMDPYRKRIAPGDIASVHPRAMRRGPMAGLGSDFIGIEYGENKAVNVSPKDAAGFVQAIKHGTGHPGGP